ncbi:hemin uptake protein HemP [Stappia indica]|uniref:hemin uptake protein HemP n=1 Tax=Stappia indica TaxID=538381 RepID=UPI001CD75C48|nr:hemin uptake protein HemP [Stappia indica]MCA1299161.1 hemin uptake protein HemP [Stappia indica]
MPETPHARRETLTAPVGSGAGKDQPTPAVLDSEALFKGARELHIRHKDMIYRLSITRFEKLLLTK